MSVSSFAHVDSSLILGVVHERSNDVSEKPPNLLRSTGASPRQVTEVEHYTCYVISDISKCQSCVEEHFSIVVSVPGPFVVLVAGVFQSVVAVFGNVINLADEEQDFLEHLVPLLIVYGSQKRS